MQDTTPTILSQYAQAPVINSVIDTFNAAMDPSGNIDEFYALVWNIVTAVGFGQDIWGRILGIGRVLTISTGNYLGFTGPSGSSGDSFNVAPWYNGSSLTSNYPLSDPAYLVLLLAKAAANICDDGIPSINSILLMLFPGRGNAYVTDGLNMTMTYSFAFTLSAVDFAIVNAFAGFLSPCGVAWSIVEV